MEVFCFNDIIDGIQHFVKTTKVKAERLPTPDEKELIKKEKESLPPLEWTRQTIEILPSGYIRFPFSTDVTPGSVVLTTEGGSPRLFIKKPGED
jgi:hypothetical protein